MRVYRWSLATVLTSDSAWAAQFLFKGLSGPTCGMGRRDVISITPGVSRVMASQEDCVLILGD